MMACNGLWNWAVAVSRSVSRTGRDVCISPSPFPSSVQTPHSVSFQVAATRAPGVPCNPKVTSPSLPASTVELTPAKPFHKISDAFHFHSWAPVYVDWPIVGACSAGAVPWVWNKRS